jgi:hypothetical protein
MCVACNLRDSHGKKAALCVLASVGAVLHLERFAIRVGGLHFRQAALDEAADGEKNL